uniref:Uncharacterized protein n=1 Tax=Timema tahoe TaxID=61484 RepID=A0A7R9NU41_9NEOP|nr:unnamed protein product [Timema tahoe]
MAEQLLKLVRTFLWRPLVAKRLDLNPRTMAATTSVNLRSVVRSVAVLLVGMVLAWPVSGLPTQKFRDLSGNCVASCSNRRYQRSLRKLCVKLALRCLESRYLTHNDPLREGFQEYHADNNLDPDDSVVRHLDSIGIDDIYQKAAILQSDVISVVLELSSRVQSGLTSVKESLLLPGVASRCSKHKIDLFGLRSSNDV